jgi:hypothetical protein
MRQREVKIGKLYITKNQTVLECMDLGEGRFPRIPQFKVIFPFPGQVRVMQPRELERELSEREAEHYKKAG